MLRRRLSLWKGRTEWGADDLKGYLEQFGARLMVVPAVTDGGGPVSSTRIRNLIREGNMPEGARGCLARRTALPLK